MNNNILITGAVGFIGFHLCKNLINKGFFVIGLDNINNYYDVNLKNRRLNEINKLNKKNKSNWKFYKGNLEDSKLLQKIFEVDKPEIVINLAAQAGVRYSIKNPYAYVSSNLIGFNNLLEFCRKFPIKHFLFASSSSVYGSNKKQPFCESDPVDHPISLYAATKRSNELVAHAYSHLYQIPCTGMRFFTVYGPWGRPDMAPMIFAKSILTNKPINIFNNGFMSRDFTYIDDVIKTVFLLISKIPQLNKDLDFINIPSKSCAPFRILNIGNSSPTNLMDFIEYLEKEFDIKAIKNYKEMQKGDVQNTFSDSSELEKLIKFKPETSLKEGVKKFVIWYKEFYNF